jgi:hypothetical protein
VRLITFRRLEWLSFAHSAVYLGLLTASIMDLERATTVLGWTHGIGWIVMSLLVLVALRARIVPLWLAVTVAVIGGIGPFAGSIGFVVEDRRRSG